MSNRPFQYCPLCATPLRIQKKSGEEHLTCPNCGWVHYEDPKVAAGAVVLKDGKILLVRRNLKPEAGKWTIPAGFVNAFEDPAKTAQRECREETGLSIEIEELVDLFAGREHERGADIFLVYKAHALGGILCPSDEVSQAEWFDLANLPEFAFSIMQKVINKLINS